MCKLVLTHSVGISIEKTWIFVNKLMLAMHVKVIILGCFIKCTNVINKQDWGCKWISI